MDYYQQGPHSSGERDPYAPQGFRDQRVPIVAEDVIKLSEKVMFPITEYPGYNFVGRLLGPKGSTLKGLQASTKTKMSILGKGSSKDKKKEEELSQSDDPDHAHLKEALHVLIQVQAPKIEAHRKMSTALKELYPFMVPESEENMQEPMNERSYNDGYRGPAAHRGPPGGYRDGAPPPRAGPRDGSRGPPPASDQYGYDPYYEGSQRESYNRPGENRMSSSNGFQLKRYER